VPGFGPGTRPAELINRMFDGLQGQAVERFNWSIQADNALYHPLSNVERIDRATNRPTRFPDGDVRAHAFIRVERQTLRKLPSSRDILFTIRIHLDPLAVLDRHPDRATLALSSSAPSQSVGAHCIASWLATTIWVARLLDLNGRSVARSAIRHCVATTLRAPPASSGAVSP